MPTRPRTMSVSISVLSSSKYYRIVRRTFRNQRIFFMQPTNIQHTPCRMLGYGDHGPVVSRTHVCVSPLTMKESQRSALQSARTMCVSSCSIVSSRASKGRNAPGVAVGRTASSAQRENKEHQTQLRVSTSPGYDEHHIHQNSRRM